MVMGQRLVRHLVAVIGRLDAGRLRGGEQPLSRDGSGARAAHPSALPAAAQPASHVQPARCTPGELRLAQVVLSPVTGEHRSFHKLVSHGRRVCTLDGYPQIRLYAHVAPCRCATPAAAART
jgi:hypothetical protein